jgi:FkbM family methyltransferase
MLQNFTDTPPVNKYLSNISGNLAYDVGANGGFISNHLAEHFNEVLSIEPAEESFANLKKHAAPNIRPINIAASDHDGEQDFRVTRLTSALGELFTGFAIDHWGPTLATRTVPCMTLDSLALKYGTPDFVKIDTEGHEVKIVDGAHTVFKEHPKFVIEIHEYENGEIIKEYFDGIGVLYDTIHHHAYTKSSPSYNSHYWLVSPNDDDR